MTTPAYDINEIMKRVKSLRQFTVTRELPESFKFTSNIPFDVNVSGNIAKFKIYAISLTEAETKVQEFLDTHD